MGAGEVWRGSGCGDRMKVVNVNNGQGNGGGGGLADSFETVAANLDASGATFTYSGDDLAEIEYANGVVKTFAYGPDGLASVTLSGAVPAGIDLVKSLQYTGGELTAIIYS